MKNSTPQTQLNPHHSKHWSSHCHLNGFFKKIKDLASIILYPRCKPHNLNDIIMHQSWMDPWFHKWRCLIDVLSVE